MKECPTCSRVYADESLRFCLDDGAALISRGSGAQPTVRIYPAGTSAKATEVLPGSRLTPAPQQPQSLIPWVVTGAALLLVAIMGIGVTILVITNRQSSPPPPNANGSPANRKGANPTPSPGTQNDAINLLGTKWTQTSTVSQMKEVIFNANGIINTDPTDKWWQNGNTVIMEFTNGYARYEGTITGDRIDYKAHNKVNLDWTGTFYRVK